MKFPKLKILDQSQVEAIHSTSLRILAEVGLKFYSDTALKLFEDTGAGVDYKKKIVKISEDAVSETLRMAPKKITCHSRNPRHGFTLGNGKVYFTNGFGATRVLDPNSNEPRTATLRDLENFTLIADALEYVHWVIPHIIPQDIPKEVCDRYMALAILSNTSKHCTLIPFSSEGLTDILKMAKIVAGGEEEFRKRPTLIGSGCQPTSPLQYSLDASENLITLSRNMVLIDICVGPIAGATAPPTLAGTVAEGNAEFLAGLALCQAAKPGAPVIYGSMASIMDPRRGVFACGPELAVMNVCFKQMSDYYKLPFYGTGGVTGSPMPDLQSIYEGTLSNIVEALACVDVIHDGVYGILEVGMTANYEHFIVSHEIVSSIMRVIRGIEVNEKTLAFDLIKKAGPGRSFLELPEAVELLRKIMREEYWIPELTVRLGRKEWEERGAKNMGQRAIEKAEKILREHRPDPPLPQEARAKLEEIARQGHMKAARISS